MKSLGLQAVRNPYLATAAVWLLLLPLLQAPSHSHQIGTNRAHCVTCQLAVFTGALAIASAATVVLVSVRRLPVEAATKPLVRSGSSSLGRAPPSGSAD
jgi:hypothetical protein